MKGDEERWNKRYASSKFPSEPHEVIKNYFNLAQKGKALDIACGNGRNAVFLSQQGFKVDAVDISEVGLTIAREKSDKINFIKADLDTYQIVPDTYDLIVNINFLQRHLFASIMAGLKPNGLLIFQTFMDPRLTGATFDPNKEQRYLKPNELLRPFLDLRILKYEEKEVRWSNGELYLAASLIARKESDLDLR